MVENLDSLENSIFVRGSTEAELLGCSIVNSQQKHVTELYFNKVIRP